MRINKSKNHPALMFSTLWCHREIAIQLLKRDILSKYRGSFGGLFWLLISPLLMLGLYTIVFGIIMHVRWPGVDSTLTYSLILFTGLIFSNFFSECLSRASTLIVSNPNFVKKVVFPLEIYPWISVGSALFHAFINTVILALFSLLLLGKVYLTIFLMPLLFLPLTIVTVGISWFLCSVGVYVRDVAHIMPFIMQILIYLSPIFYATNKLPSIAQKALLLNPLTYIIQEARNLVIFGQTPGWLNLGLYFLISLVVAWLGFVWFQNTREGFADVL